MASKGDFHTHSTASDGRLTPTQIVDLAASQGVRYHALTDHDSTEGIAEAQAAAAKHPGYVLIPGVEMGTDIEGAEVHMLGLYLDPDDGALQEMLARLREGRIGRGYGIVQKLRGMGIMIEWERVQQIAGDASVGRPHVAQALVEAGYVDKVADAFDRWIGRNGPAYVEREKMTPAECVRCIVERGGMACIAHPADLDGLDAILAELKAAGMAAMEVFYKSYPPETVERLHRAAQRHGLLPLGGSDYHGIFGNDEPLPGNIPLPDWAIERMLEHARTLPNRALVQ
ncbi:MAG TPA: PHP domain-containing protein [Dehalococcoidia bacterium]|nr:PHP domain-containing protein [Dehalococcoidia bacterium]